MNSKLPYDFDLHFDIKSYETLVRLLNEDNIEGDEDLLFDLIELHNIKIPKHLRRIKTKFPTTVWIDNSGRYIREPPSKRDEHLYSRMVIPRKWLFSL